MENDRLAKWRRRPAAGQEPVTKNQEPPTVYPFTPREQGGKPPYVAFATKDRQEHLEIRGCSDGWTHLPACHLLLDMAYDRTGSKLVLVYSFMVVEIEGKNLRAVVHAIRLKTCEFIQSFDPQMFMQPTDQDAPFIEKIEVTANEKRSR